MNLIKAEVVGSRRIDYSNKQGNAIKGFEYHFTFLDDDVKGLACGSCFVSDRETEGHYFKEGDIISFGYDRYGKRKFNYLPI